MSWVLLPCSWGAGVCSYDDSKGMIQCRCLVSVHLIILMVWFGAGDCSCDDSEGYDSVLVSICLMILMVWFVAGVCSYDDYKVWYSAIIWSSNHSDGTIWCWCLFIWWILMVRFSAGVCSSDDSEGTLEAKIRYIIMWVHSDGTGNHFILLCFICFILQWKCVTVHIMQ
jgi:hypothetical protein